MIESEHIGSSEIQVFHRADMQFQGQSHVLGVNLPSSDVTTDQLKELFAQAYWHRFEVELSELRPVLVNLHTAVIGTRKALPLDAIQPTEDRKGNVQPSTRPVWFDGSWVETPIYQRELLRSKQQLAGPAIIEQLDTTTVIEPADRAHVDACGNVIIEIGRK